VDHHTCHAWASVAFMPHDEKKRIVITLDGVGDGISGSINVFDGVLMQRKQSFKQSQSLGFLYGSIVDLLGMKRLEHEFKIMGLAPYAKKISGEKAYEEMRKIFWFDANSMKIHTAFDMSWATSNLLSRDLTVRYRFDSIAYGIQKLTEEIIKDIVRASIKKYNIPNIVVGGGVFMNVKANQQVSDLPEVSSMVITPSCGDESLAIGAAIYGYLKKCGGLDDLAKLENLYLGSEYSDEEIKMAIDSYLGSSKWKITHYGPSTSIKVEDIVAKLLASDAIVGRFKGRAEWGARALGNRSILANPSSRDNVKVINDIIKGRDFWMPFAVSLIYERQKKYLKNNRNLYAPYMTITFNTTTQAHKEIIAGLHQYDLTSRPQMVKRDVNPDYYDLISSFEKLTGISGVLNTSFNLHGEPNVETHYDALRTFDLSGLKYLAIGNYLCSKN